MIHKFFPEGGRLHIILKNLYYLSVENGLRIGLGFFISAWMTRMLGPEQFGVLSYVIGFGLIFAPLFSLGSDDIVISKLVGEVPNSSEVMGSSFMIKVIGSVLGSVSCIFAIWLIDGENRLITTLVSLYALSMTLKIFENTNLWFVGQEEIKEISMARNIVFLVLSAARVVGLYFKWEVSWFLSIAAAEFFLVAIVSLIVYRAKGMNIFSWTINWDLIKEILARSVPLFLILVFTILTAKIDQIMLGKMMDKYHLGQYSAAVKLIELWNFIPMALLSSTFPTLIDAFNNRPEAFEGHVVKVYAGCFYLALGLILVCFFFGDFITGTLYGEKYGDSGHYLRLYSLSAMASFFTMARVKILTISSKIYSALFCMGFQVLLLILLNIYLIPKYQVSGAIYSVLASFLISNILVSLFNRDIRESLKHLSLSCLYPFKLLGAKK